MRLVSSHKAIVVGQVIDRHVPLQKINRLLGEQPGMIRFASPGIPVGSAVMENAGVAAKP